LKKLKFRVIIMEGRGKITNQEIDIDAAIANVREQLNKEKNISPTFKSAIELLITVCQILMSRFLKKNSKNSNLPPAMDPNREKTSKAKNKRKPGGQPGHEGNTL
jgi:transposase